MGLLKVLLAFIFIFNTMVLPVFAVDTTKNENEKDVIPALQAGFTPVSIQTVTTQPAQIVKTGTIKFMDLEGGFYGIVADDGTKYDPVYLPDVFKKDGLKVSFEANPATGMSSTHMWGTLILVSDIETSSPNTPVVPPIIKDDKIGQPLSTQEQQELTKIFGTTPTRSEMKDFWTTNAIPPSTGYSIYYYDDAGGFIGKKVVTDSNTGSHGEKFYDSKDNLIPADSAPAQIVKTGTVKYIDLEGGFYGIVSDDGQRYDPVYLPDAFKKDGLKVSFEANPAEGMASIHMWGTLIKISDIKTVSENTPIGISPINETKYIPFSDPAINEKVIDYVSKSAGVDKGTLKVTESLRVEDNLAGTNDIVLKVKSTNGTTYDVKGTQVVYPGAEWQFSITKTSSEPKPTTRAEARQTLQKAIKSAREERKAAQTEYNEQIKIINDTQKAGRETARTTLKTGLQAAHSDIKAAFTAYRETIKNGNKDPQARAAARETLKTSLADAHTKMKASQTAYKETIKALAETARTGKENALKVLKDAYSTAKDKINAAYEAYRLALQGMGLASSSLKHH